MPRTETAYWFFSLIIILLILPSMASVQDEEIIDEQSFYSIGISDITLEITIYMDGDGKYSSFVPHVHKIWKGGETVIYSTDGEPDQRVIEMVMFLDDSDEIEDPIFVSAKVHFTNGEEGNFTLIEDFKRYKEIDDNWGVRGKVNSSYFVYPDRPATVDNQSISLMTEILWIGALVGILLFVVPPLVWLFATISKYLANR